MNARRSCLGTAVLLVLGLILTSSNVHAAYQTNPGKVSIGLIKLCMSAAYAAGHPLSCWLAVYDPPGDISQFGLEVQYNPSEITIVQAGFLCDFSSDGSCPVTIPGIVNPPQPVTLGDPRAGTSYTLTNTAGILTLEYDLSANPTSSASDRNVFGFFFETSEPVASFTFTYTTDTGDLFQVPSGSSCNGVLGGACGSASPVDGFTMTFVAPEPATIGTFAVGLAGLARLRRAGRTMPNGGSATPA